jgi:O-antigen ligase
MTLIKRIAQLLLLVEPFVIGITLYYFWFPSSYPFSVGEPIDRASYAGLLLGLPVFMLLRFIAYGRFFTFTPLIPWLVALLVLGQVNVSVAPYDTRGVFEPLPGIAISFLLTRVILGVWIVVALTELARATRSMLPPLVLVGAFSLTLGIVALGTTQWVSKSDALNFIIRALPRFNIPFVGTFNPNEVAGAIAWLVPMAAGLALYPWWRELTRAFTAGSSENQTQRSRPFVFGGLVLTLLAVLAFVTLFLALFVGQSRFAIAGVILGLAGLALFVVPMTIPRLAAIAGLALVVAIQGALLFNLFPAATATAQGGGAQPGISSRDESSFSRRFDIWRSGLNMVVDHPLTGVGLNNFRFGEVRQAYPVVTYDFNCPQNCPRILPHAHNEFVQIATDFGVPGLLIFIGWHVATAFMLWEVWRKGDSAAQVVAVAVVGGIVAHGVFGMGDAITLWDRFYFVHWLLIGLASAQYVLVTRRETTT